MGKTNTIDQYIDIFLRLLKKNIKSGIGVKCDVFPSEKDGAILEFLLKPEIKEETEYHSPTASINEALQHVEQNLISGNLSNVKFSGTNISIQGNKITIIKGEDSEDAWGENSAVIDSVRIEQMLRGAQSGR